MEQCLSPIVNLYGAVSVIYNNTYRPKLYGSEAGSGGGAHNEIIYSSLSRKKIIKRIMKVTFLIVM